MLDMVPRSRVRKAIKAGKKRAEEQEARKAVQMGYCSWCLKSGEAGELSDDPDPDIRELMDAVESFTERHRMMQFAYQRFISQVLRGDSDEAKQYVDDVVEKLMEVQKGSSR